MKSVSISSRIDLFRIRDVEGELDTEKAREWADKITQCINNNNNQDNKSIIKIIDEMLNIYGKHFIRLSFGYLDVEIATKLQQIFKNNIDLNPYHNHIFSNLLFRQIELRQLSMLKRHFVSLFTKDQKDEDNNVEEVIDLLDVNKSNSYRRDPNFHEPEEVTLGDGIYLGNNNKEEERDIDSKGADEICPMIKVFGEDGNRAKGLFKPVEIDDAEYEQVYYPLTTIIGNPVITASYQMFIDVFNIFTKGVLSRVSWQEESGCRVVVAGSSVVGSLIPLTSKQGQLYHQLLWARRVIKDLPVTARDMVIGYLGLSKDSFYHSINHHFFDEPVWEKGDIDLFVVSSSTEVAKTRVLRLIEEVTSQIPVHYRLVKTDRSITILPVHPYRPVQIVTTILQCPQDYLVFCDLDNASFIFDPSKKNVFTLERGVRAFNTRYNVVGPTQWRVSGDRCQKYYNRGFGTIVYEICKHVPRCDTIRYMSGFYESSVLPSGTSINTPEKLDKELNKVSDTYPLLDEFNGLPDNIEIQWKYSYEMNLKKPTCYQCSQDIGYEDLVGIDYKTRPPLCPGCRQTNQDKWNQWDGIKLDQDTIKYALITGGRIKIGYQAALRLLKSGYAVMVTTRFPHVTVQRYKEEPDYDEWSDRLSVYGVDLRHLPSVDQMIKHVRTTFPRLDIIINNAAQTIRRPRAYYHSLLQTEKRLSLDQGLKYNLVGSSSNMPDAINASPVLSLVMPTGSQPTSAEMTQMVLHEQDVDERNDKLFPVGKHDEHGEQLDLRTQTSWNAQIEDISPVEMMEVQVVNATVPFMIISQLSCLMGTHRKDNRSTTDWGYIVNVTSPEGAFDASKQTGFHVHTNMAKASLNMMTKSIASSYLPKQIFVCATDVGWVTKMQPAADIPESSTSMEAPLTDRDGAARCLDPIFIKLESISELLKSTSKASMPIVTTLMSKDHGSLFKHYQSHPW